MRRRLLCFLILFACMGLSACGSDSDADTNTIILENDGSVTSVIYEEFQKEYYSEEELKEFMTQEVAEYNQQKVDAVSVSKIEVEEGNVKVIMKFKTAEDYAAFNGKNFFYGTIKEAYDLGMNLDVTLLDIKDEGNEVEKADLLEMGEKKLIVFDEAVHVRVSGKIAYASEDLTVYKEKEVASMVEEDSYIVLK